MTLTFLGTDSTPTYLAESADIASNGTISGAILIGRTVYITDVPEWKIILPNLKLAPFNPIGSGTAGVAPEYVSSEIGTVDAETIVLTLSENVVAEDYALGWILEKNGDAEPILSGTRQSTHSIIHFGVAEMLDSDVLTLRYDSSVGGIASETGIVYMENVSSQTVTNNIV